MSTARELTRCNWLSACLLAVAAIGGNLEAADGPSLVRDGRSAYAIHVPPSAASQDRAAAEVLARYLKAATGAELPVRTDRPGRAALVVGRDADLRAWGFEGRLKPEAFALETRGHRIYVAGGEGKGALYGAYAFVERVLGARKYVPGPATVPHLESLPLPRLKVRESPAFTFRTALVFDGAGHPKEGAAHPVDQEFLDWHHLHGRTPGETAQWGLFVHTFQKLVPPERWFRAHPEYFSLVNGVRNPDAQLCLSHPAVLEVVCAALAEAMGAKPQAKYWSVSQNDTFGPCECEACRTLDRKHGGHQGSLLTFVNLVAARFPDKVISTLAYQYTRSAPKGLKPAPNVNIMLCSIECNRSRPLAKDPGSADFRKDVSDWARLTRNILLWDYVVNFHGYLEPFPNLRVLQPNLRHFRSQGLEAMFQQGSGQPNHDLQDLRAYLVANLLWNPDADVRALTADFLKGFYGPAAPFVAEYVGRLHDGMERSGESLLIYENPRAHAGSWLAPERIAEYEALVAKAQAAVLDQPTFLTRVKRLQLSLDYAALELSKLKATGAWGLFQVAPDGSRWPRPELKARLERFVRECYELGCPRLDENNRTPVEYEAGFEALWQGGMRASLATGCAVTLPEPPARKYTAGGPSTLTDGLRGGPEYAFSWLGWEGRDVEIRVDLGAERTLKTLWTGALQDIASWILLPREVSFALSTDGAAYTEVGSARHTVPEREKTKRSHTFQVDFAPVRARFLRIRAKAYGPLPAWHLGKGGPSWVFIDEVGAG